MSADDKYTVQQQIGGEWTDWSNVMDFFRAEATARLARKLGRTVRVVDFFGNVVA